jgi:thymidylate synthase
MFIYKGKTFAEAYRKSLVDLVENGQTCETRGTVSKEQLNVSLVIEDPSQCMYTNTVRSTQFKYIAAEFLWYYAGRNDVKFISKYAKFWEQIQNDNGTVNSAYGNLIFKPKNIGGLSQYEWAITSLIKDKDSRQAVMHFNMPEHQYRGNKDFVCTMYGIFHIRENKLHFSVFMRSNDAIWGTPTDVAFFCSLQKQALAHLLEYYPELELGTYTHHANSYHIYDRHFDLVDRMLKKPFKTATLPPIKTNLVDIDGSQTEEFKDTFDFVAKVYDNDVLIMQEKDDLLTWIINQLEATP